MTLTKVTEATLQAIVSTTSNLVNIGSAVDVAAYYSGDFRLRMGRATSSAFTVGPKYRVEGTYKVSPTDNEWITLAEFQSMLGVSIASSAVSGTEAIGQTVVSVTSGTNFTADDFVFFHNTTLGNSEWKHIVSVATNDLTVQDPLVFVQTGATARDQAEEYHFLLDLTGIQKIRLIVNNAGTGQAVICECGFGAVSAL